jgi:hypothetical protein
MTTLNGTYEQFVPTNRQLPNGGGSYQSVTSNTNANPLFSNKTATMPKEYINPATGKLWDPQEYANNVAKTLPISKPIGDVPQYTADQFTQPAQTTEQLTSTATRLNNSANDLATGTTDPYDITKGGSIVYSPTEKEAIRKAYSGVYDPAITTALFKLEEKQKADAAVIKDKKDREDRVFATNESIRQWKATTGLDKVDGKDLFTQSQLNSGAANSGLGIEAFDQLDSDLKNFYINAPTELNPETNKMVPMYESFANLVKNANLGHTTSKAAADEIEASTLPESVKHYFIDQLDTLPVAEKEGYFSGIWKALKGE